MRTHERKVQMKTTKKMSIAGICLMLLLMCSPNMTFAGENISSGQENTQQSLYIQFIYENTGKTVTIDGVDVPISKISSFVFKDAQAHQEIQYETLVIGGNAVVGSRVFSESGMNGMDVVEFSFGDGKYISFSAPVKRTISKKYTLKSGTLTLID